MSWTRRTANDQAFSRQICSPGPFRHIQPCTPSRTAVSSPIRSSWHNVSATCAVHCRDRAYVIGYLAVDLYPAKSSLHGQRHNPSQFKRFHMAHVKLYTTPWCPYCIAAKRLFAQKKIKIEDVNVSGDPETRAWLREVTGQHTVPQIFIDGISIGGFSDAQALDQRGELDAMLSSSSAAPL